MVESLLCQKLGLDPNNEDYRRAYLTCFLSLLVLAAGFFFLLYNSIWIFYLPLVIIDSCAVLLSITCLYLLLIKGKVELAGGVLVCAVFVLTYFYIADVGHQEYALVYSLLLPVLAIFLLGFKRGSLVSLAYFILLFHLSLSNIGHWQPAVYGLNSFINVIALYISFFVLACYFELSRKNAFKLLSELNHKLELQATTDELTAIFNRRYIEDRLIATKEACYFAMTDVDDFKNVNDGYGHITGDEVLQKVAAIMKNIIGKQGVVARWGGEEFAILFNSDDKHQFLELMETMRQAVMQQDFGIPRGISLSIGCTLHSQGQHKETLRRVDDGLYQAKNAGKNCIKVNL